MYTLEPKNWVSLYADYLLRYALFRLNNVEYCEDLVQDTFLSAWRSKETFKGNSSEKTWLTAILKNKIIDAYRKNARSFQTGNADNQGDKIDEPFFETNEDGVLHWKKEHQPSDWGNNAMESIIQKEYLQVLQNCMMKLNPLQANILHEKYFEGTASDKICKDFNISKSNYWTMIHRINLTLRKCIELHWFNKHI